MYALSLNCMKNTPFIDLPYNIGNEGWVPTTTGR